MSEPEVLNIEDQEILQFLKKMNAKNLMQVMLRRRGCMVPRRFCSSVASTSNNTAPNVSTGPGLGHFIAKSVGNHNVIDVSETKTDSIPYIDPRQLRGDGKKGMGM